MVTAKLEPTNFPLWLVEYAINFVKFYRAFSIKGGNNFEVVHSGVEAVLYSDSMVGNLLNSEDCFTLSPVLCIFRISYSAIQCVSCQMPCLSKKIPTKQQNNRKQTNNILSITQTKNQDA